jgi:hypothetical protein
VSLTNTVALRERRVRRRCWTIFGEGVVEFDLQWKKSEKGRLQESLEMLREDLLLVLLPVLVIPVVVDREEVINES